MEPALMIAAIKEPYEYMQKTISMVRAYTYRHNWEYIDTTNTICSICMLLYMQTNKTPPNGSGCDASLLRSLYEHITTSNIDASFNNR